MLGCVCWGILVPLGTVLRLVNNPDLEVVMIVWMKHNTSAGYIVFHKNWEYVVIQINV